MDALEIKKLQAQKARMEANRMDFEVKLEELKQAQARVENEIAIVDRSIQEINRKLKE